MHLILVHILDATLVMTNHMKSKDMPKPFIQMMPTLNVINATKGFQQMKNYGYTKELCILKQAQMTSNVIDVTSTTRTGNYSGITSKSLMKMEVSSVKSVAKNSPMN